YVLFNLIKNALYYKEKPGFKIEISTETGSSDNTIKVKDTGPGVPASMREKVFESFFTSGKKDGIGLGLAFCKRVVTSFKGTITCDSKENEWTEFTIRFPLYDSKKVDVLKKNVLSTKDILIADDSPGHRMIVDKYLREWQCNTHSAENGSQALSMLSRKNFDLIIMDLEMPIMTGDEAARRIRLEKHNTPHLAAKYKEIPIIGVSALPASEAKERVAAAEMNEFIAKPLKRKDIFPMFEKYFFSETQLTTFSTNLALDEAEMLIVDDNVTSRKFMSIILERMGAHVTQAENGEEAIQYMEENDYEIVFMDMEMPVLNGVDTTKIIREGKCFKRFKKYKEIPIIALTGNTDNESIALTKKSGMNDHLGKPVEKENLNRILSNWLQI
ncbi:MAG: response regulator, partial [Candidatus Omnitrophica bacterium]|nr:response regulator [Candidatus Omnitrophota bacterium]